MAKLTLIWLKCTGSNPKNLEIQPRLETQGGKKVGKSTKITASDTVPISLQGNNPAQAGSNPLEVNIDGKRLVAVDVRPGEDQPYEGVSLKLTSGTWYTFKTAPGQTKIQIYYKAEDNFANFTLSYVTRVVTIVTQAIQDFVSATGIYFSGVLFLLTAPLRRSTDETISDRPDEPDDQLVESVAEPESVIESGSLENTNLTESTDSEEPDQD